MPKRIFVCAPHADDELIGLGGTLLKHINDGDEVFIAFITHPKAKFGYDVKFDQQRNLEVNNCMADLGLNKLSYHIMGYRPASLNFEELGTLIIDLKELVEKFKPHTIYTPNAEDIHSDHYFVSRAIDAISKSFRNSSIKRVISYETISETDISLLLEKNYKPNLYINIEEFIEKKIALLKNYPTEMGEAPFPRSPDVIRAHAIWRGSQANYLYAEAHKILVDRRD